MVIETLVALIMWNSYTTEYSGRQAETVMRPRVLERFASTEACNKRLPAVAQANQGKFLSCLPVSYFPSPAPPPLNRMEAKPLTKTREADWPPRKSP